LGNLICETAQLWSGEAGTWPNTGGNANVVPTVANGMVYVARTRSRWRSPRPDRSPAAPGRTLPARAPTCSRCWRSMATMSFASSASFRRSECPIAGPWSHCSRSRRQNWRSSRLRPAPLMGNDPRGQRQPPDLGAAQRPKTDGRRESFRRRRRTSVRSAARWPPAAP